MCCDCCWPQGKEIANNKFTRRRAKRFAKQMAIKNIPIEGELRLTRRGKIVVAILVIAAMIAILWLTKDYMWFNGRYMKFEDVQKYIQAHPEPTPTELVYPLSATRTTLNTAFSHAKDATQAILITYAPAHTASQNSLFAQNALQKQRQMVNVTQKTCV